MEQEDKKIPFPQANDFNKIYNLICMDDESKLIDKEYLKTYLNLGTERQIAYYLSACEFLGVINRSKEYTELGKNIRNTNSDLRIVMICKIIISIIIFIKIYSYW